MIPPRCGKSCRGRREGRRGRSGGEGGRAAARPCEEAEDAETAIRMVRAGVFDTVLLDLTMPGLGGLTALPMLKAENPSAKIYVVTSKSDTETVKACKAAGADGFLIKPVHPEKLQKLLAQNNAA